MLNNNQSCTRRKNDIHSMKWRYSTETCLNQTSWEPAFVFGIDKCWFIQVNLPKVSYIESLFIVRFIQDFILYGACFRHVLLYLYTEKNLHCAEDIHILIKQAKKIGLGLCECGGFKLFSPMIICKYNAVIFCYESVVKCYLFVETMVSVQ